MDGELVSTVSHTGGMTEVYLVILQVRLHLKHADAIVQLPSY
jgi:hypothetical protein